MTTLDPAQPSQLPPTTCPQALWQSVRDQILDHPKAWPALADDGHWLADWLWRTWAAPLQALGVTNDLLAEVVAGYQRELWLWLMGERTWTHTRTSLAGRTLRRAASMRAGVGLEETQPPA